MNLIKKYKDKIKDILFITLGVALGSFAFSFFLNPRDINIGGTSGIGKACKEYFESKGYKFVGEYTANIYGETARFELLNNGVCFGYNRGAKDITTYSIVSDTVIMVEGTMFTVDFYNMTLSPADITDTNVKFN